MAKFRLRLENHHVDYWVAEIRVATVVEVAKLMFGRQGRGSMNILYIYANFPNL